MKYNLDIEAVKSLDTRFEARGVHGDSIKDILEAEPLVVVYFLRHLGCVHCRHLVNQLNKMRQNNPRFPKVIFVHQEDIQKGAKFFEVWFPDAAHISDPTKTLYETFNIKRAKTSSLFAPKTIAKSFTRLFKVGQALVPTADPNLLSGMFLFKDGDLLWAHRANTIGDDKASINKISQMGKMFATQ